MTQVQSLLHHLVTVGSITPLEADEVHGIKRLASRIHDLKKIGLRVQRKMKKDIRGHKYAEYRLVS